ncbi:hypothetical protein B0T18DRAFT_397781 [Schizothecium vesticola]|uniref:Uncharacterized protein n=1 Tax=Schizothecium vesticola TaxID=314040 RepID=A0AA40KCD7_9PEZI|nr:hypothetical protein B0T18DRAFT_397781 [Schizothecium vesticola]
MQGGAPVGRETPLLPWRPTYLRLSVLIGFFLVFAAGTAAPEVLLRISMANNGLGTADARQQYLWKYGPTAILTVIAALWRRVEYQSKLVAPWVRLSQPTDASNTEETLLLDYITSLQPTALVRSLRNRDFVVALVIGTSILMKIDVRIFRLDSRTLLDRCLPNCSPNGHHGPLRGRCLPPLRPERHRIVHHRGGPPTEPSPSGWTFEGLRFPVRSLRSPDRH